MSELMSLLVAFVGLVVLTAYLTWMEWSRSEEQQQSEYQKQLKYQAWQVESRQAMELGLARLQQDEGHRDEPSQDLKNQNT